MTANFALIIGVETYQDATIKPVRFAEADATNFAAALVAHGFDPANQVLLTSAQATKNTIESRVRRLIGRLTDEDVFYFFYAGHGFSKNGQNYITCHDTQLGDLANTSIPLQNIFLQLKTSACHRVAMFLDSCEAGMTASADMRGIYSSFTAEELEDFFKEAEFHVCFASCKTNQYSYPSNKLGHGVWSYHVLEALRGNAAIATEAKGLVTVASLQNYLAKEVPTWLAKNRTDGAKQTPWLYGTMSREFVVANVQPLIEQRLAASRSDRSLKRALLSKTLPGGRVRSLSGFRRGHKEPDRVSEATTRFLGQIAQAELTEDIDKVLDALREQFGYQRKDLQHGISGTAGAIVTPDFEYNVEVSLDPEDPSLILWRYELANIHDPAVIDRKELQTVFGNTFDTVELEFKEPLDLATFIDALEAAEIKVKYDAALTECTFSLPGVPGTIRVTDGRFELVQPRGMPPKALVAGFQKAQQLLEGKAAGALPA